MKPQADRRDAGFDRLLERTLSRESSLPADSCPDTEVLAAWFDGSLGRTHGEGGHGARPATAGSHETGEERVRVEAHLAACRRCQDVLAGLARAEPEVLYVHPQPERRPPAWHLRWLAPLAAAAVVVLIVGSEALRSPTPARSGSSSIATKTPASPSAKGGVPEGQLAVRAPAQLPLSEEAGQARLSAKVAKERVEGGGTGAASTEARRDKAMEVSKEARRDKDTAAPAAKPQPTFATDAVGERAGFVGQRAPTEAKAGRAQAEAVAPRAENVAPSGVAAENRPAAPAPTTVATTLSQDAAARPRVAPIAASPAEPAGFAPGGRVGWRYSRPGVVSQTSDAGITWVEQPVPGDARLSTFSAVSPDVCWAAGRDGALLRTTDGRTWLAVTPPARADFVFILARDDAHASVRTADGITYDTSDAGVAWRRR